MFEGIPNQGKGVHSESHHNWQNCASYAVHSFCSLCLSDIQKMYITDQISFLEEYLSHLDSFSEPTGSINTWNLVLLCLAAGEKEGRHTQVFIGAKFNFLPLPACSLFYVYSSLADRFDLKMLNLHINNSWKNDKQKIPIMALFLITNMIVWKMFFDDLI